MKLLGYRQVLWIYRRVMEETGGSFGIRDDGLLRSALARPQASFGGQDLYPTLFEKAAALLESLVMNHPFTDGNKRVAWECLDLVLEMNGFHLTTPHDENFKLVLKIIERKATVQDVADWLKQHAQRELDRLPDADFRRVDAAILRAHFKRSSSRKRGSIRPLRFPLSRE